MNQLLTHDFPADEFNIIRVNGYELFYRVPHPKHHQLIVTLDGERSAGEWLLNILVEPEDLEETYSLVFHVLNGKYTITLEELETIMVERMEPGFKLETTFKKMGLHPGDGFVILDIAGAEKIAAIKQVQYPEMLRQRANEILAPEGRQLTGPVILSEMGKPKSNLN